AFIEQEKRYLEVAEYTPIWWQASNSIPPTSTVKSGQATVQSIDDIGAHQSYLIDANTQSLVSFRPLYFPGWIARIDGQVAKISPDEQGNIQLTIESGKHSLTLDFEDTWIRIAGKIISAVSLLITLIIAFRGRHIISAKDRA